MTRAILLIIIMLLLSTLGTYKVVSVSSVMSDSLQPHGLWPTRLLCPWDYPSKNTGVGCHFLLQGIFLTQGLNPCLLHWQEDSLPLSHQCVVITARSDSVIPWTIAHLQAPLSVGILQARIMEWIAMPRASSWLRDRTHISYASCIGIWVLRH